MALNKDLVLRTKRFVLDTINLDSLPNTRAMEVFGKQLIRCSSSVGANYRAACRAKSNADFINKLKIVEEEADESVYFLELIKEIDKKNQEAIDRMIKEGNELLAIFVASIKTTRKRVEEKPDPAFVTRHS